MCSQLTNVLAIEQDGVMIAVEDQGDVFVCVVVLLGDVNVCTWSKFQVKAQVFCRRLMGHLRTKVLRSE